MHHHKSSGGCFTALSDAPSGSGGGLTALQRKSSLGRPTIISLQQSDSMLSVNHDEEESHQDYSDDDGGGQQEGAACYQNEEDDENECEEHESDSDYDGEHRGGGKRRKISNNNSSKESSRISVTFRQPPPAGKENRNTVSNMVSLSKPKNTLQPNTGYQQTAYSLFAKQVSRTQFIACSVEMR